MTSFKQVLAVIGALFALVVAVTTFGLWRVESSLDQDKTKILVLADEFAVCLYREDVACLKAVSTWDDGELNSALEHSRVVQAQLGTRGKAQPIQNSWSMRKFSSLTSPVTTKIRVSLETAYENDPKAREWFELVEQKGTLHVRNFRVRSPKVQGVAQAAK